MKKYSLKSIEMIKTRWHDCIAFEGLLCWWICKIVAVVGYTVFLAPSPPSSCVFRTVVSARLCFAFKMVHKSAWLRQISGWCKNVYCLAFTQNQSSRHNKYIYWIHQRTAHDPHMDDRCLEQRVATGTMKVYTRSDTLHRSTQLTRTPRPATARTRWMCGVVCVATTAMYIEVAWSYW